MKIQKNSAVSMHYTLTDNDGNVVDSSQGREPLDYIQGLGMIVPGLESQLEGKSAGDKFTAVVDAAEGYGEYMDELVQEVPRSAFEGVPELEVGMNFVANGPQGQMMVTITAIEGDNVEIDGNHPLAGETLNFDIEIISVRAATAEELESAFSGGGGCGCGHDEGGCCSDDDDDDHECCGGGCHD